MIPRVWAPRAARVEVVTESGRRSLAARAGDWFVGDEPLAVGTRYSFSLDGGPLLADPRSAWQPDGADGPSAVVDHQAFPWTDQTWHGSPLAGAVIYELHVGTFSPAGTFDGAIERLDHLADLGVTLVEVMPVAAFSGDRGWGYDGVLPFAVHHAYGGPDGFKRFVDAAHQRGFGVLLDVVYNHVGPEADQLGEFGPYTHEVAGTPWGEAMNLDGEGSDEVRRYIIDNVRHWIEHYHVDGLRLDATHALVDSRAQHILAELAQEALALGAAVGRTILLVAEDDRNDPRITTAAEAGGYGLDGQWADDLHHAVHAVLTGEDAGYYVDYGSLDAVVRALAQVHHLDGQWSEHRRRGHGAPLVDEPRHRFVVAMQNHDQIGNRAGGERLVHLVGAGAVKLAAGVLLLGPCTPLLFQGEEWGASTPFRFFADFRDEELRTAVVEGRSREFAGLARRDEDLADPFAIETFDECRLRWDERDEPAHAELLDWYRRVLALRRAEPDLTDPRAARTRIERHGDVVVMRRGSLCILANFGDAAHRWQPVGRREPAPVPILASDATRIEEGKLVVAPRSLAVVRTSPDRADHAAR
ncbi:MAG: malto-oligosyltrehalose trehalohydrolase [Acidimicrobiia bacterium]